MITFAGDKHFRVDGDTNLAKREASNAINQGISLIACKTYVYTI